MENNKRKLGAEYESIAAEFLKKQGYEIICTNYYCPMGEVDIIAQDENYLVFLEVKYRKSTKYGYPAEAVSKNKQRRIVKSAQFYCMKEKTMPTQPIRFDVVSILGDTITLIKNAFDASGLI